MALLLLLICILCTFRALYGVEGRKNEPASLWQKTLAAHHQKDSNVNHFFNFSSPAPHIFSSLRGLLNQWPNTFFPNGFSIVPCEVGAYTNLYHGRRDGELPPNPEWVAFDLEMSTAIMGSSRNSHLMTYQTTKTIKCLYFDGMSAVLTGTGQLDSQMVFLHGNITGPPYKDRFRGLFDEYDRAERLCKWVLDNGVGGLGWGVEGIVRMNAGFEMIWCNFSSPSVQLVSHLNFTAPLLPDGFWDDGTNAEQSHTTYGELALGDIRSRALLPSNSVFPLPSATVRDPAETPGPDMPLPPSMRDSYELEPFLKGSLLEWFRSATWHYGASSGTSPGQGEDRIKLLTCGFATFYSPKFTELASSITAVERQILNLTADGLWKGPGSRGNRALALKQLSRRRSNHTLEEIDPLEAPHMNVAVQRILQSINATENGGTHNQCSGIDWHIISTEIGTRYSTALSQVEQVILGLQTATSNATLTKLYMFKIRSKMHSLVIPFFEYPAHAFQNSTPSKNDWTLASGFGQLTFNRCKYGHTRLLYDSSGKLKNHVEPEEKLIISSIEEVLSGICSTIISIGLAVEYEWLTRYNIPIETSTSNPTPSSNLTTLSHQWHAQLSELQAWLGWASDQIRCEKLCARDEYCYIPMWPVMFLDNIRRRPPPPRPGGRHNGTRPGYPYPYPRRPDYPRRGGRGHRGGPEEWDEDLWNPRCVKMEA